MHVVPTVLPDIFCMYAIITLHMELLGKGILDKKWVESIIVKCEK